MAEAVFDAIVVGGGPAGATAAADLAGLGRHVLLLDKAGRIKPCGGAIPPRCIRDFDIPDSQIVARATSARMTAPSGRSVDMRIDAGAVGMVDRGPFDEWLRERAAARGAERRDGQFVRLERTADGRPRIVYRDHRGEETSAVARMVVGADGAHSAVARQAMPDVAPPPRVFAYHEIVAVPADGLPAHYDGGRCDIVYDGGLSPDFYSWVFPHGATASIGTGTAVKGFSLREAVGALRSRTGLADLPTLRREGAPLPLRPRKRWDNGRDVLLAGDAAGVVAPASGEGIYYAMLGGRLAAEAIDEALASGRTRALAGARRAFMREHGMVFFILGMMQNSWYRSDGRRERFVALCLDPDIQRMTWSAYLEKRLGRIEVKAHMRIMLKDLGHLLGLVRPWDNQPDPRSFPAL